MKITFKDVGQGDSIIIEWEDEGKNKIGIIDCNTKGRTNPVLDFIKSSSYKEIEFIILSHPHRDHYSGLKGLLEYISEAKIIIHRFAHTLNLIGTEYWKWFELDSTDSGLLKSIIHMVDKLKSDKIITRIIFLSNEYEFKLSELSDKYVLRCLSPSQDESEEYMKIVSFNPEKNKKAASSAANFLSTVFKLKIESSYLLFTSDAEILSFERLLNIEREIFKEKKFHICQAPHHGSQNNYSADFWSIIETTDTKYAIFSAGEHRKYNHPDYAVVKHFHSLGYKLYATNIINGMREHADYIKQLKIKSTILDTDSEIAEEYSREGDKIFEFHDNSFRLR